MVLTQQSLLVLSIALLVSLTAALWPLRAYLGKGQVEKSARQGALLTALVAALGAVGVYVFIGRPDLGGQAYAPRIADIEARIKSDPTAPGVTPADAAALLMEISRRRPEDPVPLMHAGDLRMRLGDAPGAVRAFEEALRRDPENPDAMTSLGAALFVVEDGVVSAQARQLFETASLMRPLDPRPVLYMALGASQSGQWEDAARQWRRLQTLLPPDDPRQAMAAQMLAQATSTQPLSATPPSR